jgi:hypothetical protein
MWQNHHIRFEEWAEMPRLRKLFYIASEQYEMQHPLKRAGTVLIARKGGK